MADELFNQALVVLRWGLATGNDETLRRRRDAESAEIGRSAGCVGALYIVLDVVRYHGLLVLHRVLAAGT